MRRPRFDHTREVKWLTINDTLTQKNRQDQRKTYRTAVDLEYSLLGSISRPFSSTFFTKSKVDRTDAAVIVICEWATRLPGQILQRTLTTLEDENIWTNGKRNAMLTSYQTQIQCPWGLELNHRVLHSSKSVQAWICEVLDNPVRRSTSPYEVEFEYKSTIFADKIWPSPLVGDYNRVGGDIIVVVEIIIGRLMRNALTRQGCQLDTTNVRKE